LGLSTELRTIAAGDELVSKNGLKTCPIFYGPGEGGTELNLLKARLMS